MKFNKTYFLTVLILSLNTSLFSQSIYNLKTEYSQNPIGIDDTSPRFSWKIKSDIRGYKQSFYQIIVSDNLQNLTKDIGNVWDSKKIKSEQSLWIDYKGKALESRKKYFWKVKIWDLKGKASTWSEIGTWEMGLLNKSDWTAHWIGINGTEGKPPKPVELEKTFNLQKRAVRTRVYVTGLGAYHLIINGKKIGNDYLNPGWTNYVKTVHYQTFEIDPELLSIGSNFITATVGPGWWASGLGWNGGQARYSEGPNRLLFQLEMEYYDGSRKTIVSDETWDARLSPITISTIYHGEKYDARLEYNKERVKADILDDFENKTQLFGSPEKNQSEEIGVFSTKNIVLKSSPAPKIQVAQEIKPLSIKEFKKGKYVIDFGQNLVGFVKIRVQGKAGKEISLKFGELLNEKGLVDQANLRSIKPEDTYILKGYGVEEWEPKFTYHGFRYVEVEGFNEKPSENSIVAKTIFSKIENAGSFTTSNELINKIQSNIIWSQRGNLMDVPTDCPQRDERLGWMGDAAVFAPTASFNMNMNAFFAKWLSDIADSQHSTGYVYDTNPKIVVGGPAKPAWGDAFLIIPFKLYQFYGDIKILANHYEAMKKWVEYLNNHSNTVKNGLYHFQEGEGEKAFYGYGDWVPVEKSPTKPIGGLYQVSSNMLLSKIAGILNNKNDQVKYQNLAEKFKSKYNELYYDSAASSYSGNTQGANLLPLNFSVSNKKNNIKIVENIVNDVKKHDNHLTTGFLSTQFLLPTLSEFNQHELAYKIVNQKTYPSWGYMIEKNATTMWELWNSDTEKPEGMNSRNHFAYGSVGEWFYSYLGGIKVDTQSVGFKHFILAPMPVSDLNFAQATYESVYGNINSRWEKKANKYEYKFTIPVGSSAQIRLPLGGKQIASVKEKGISILLKNKPSKIMGLNYLQTKDGVAIFEAQSGVYEFSVE
jgi:alpha-L-rhamnosidase